MSRRTPEPPPDALFAECAARCGGIVGEPGARCDRCQQPECIHNSPARGLAARIAEWEAWLGAHGHVDANSRSHAWRPSLTCPIEPTGRCQPTVICADLRRWRSDEPWQCGCPAREHLSYRGACTGCDWEGPDRDYENLAAEDACDHAHPGWRDLPIVPLVPPWFGGGSKKERDARARWIAKVSGLYPAGWLEAGGPVRTLRQKHGTRHVPSRTPFGGYDMAALDPGDAA